MTQIIIAKAERPHWTHYGTIDVIVTLETGEVYSYHATPDDETEHGKALWSDLKAGKYGVIQAPLISKQELELAEFRANREALMKITQWIVDRHRDQIDEGIQTSITADQFQDMMKFRTNLRNAPQPDGTIAHPAIPLFLVPYIAAAVTGQDFK